MNFALFPGIQSFIPSPTAVVFAAEVDLSLMSPALRIASFAEPDSFLSE